jgi:hypothetical protein
VKPKEEKNKGGGAQRALCNTTNDVRRGKKITISAKRAQQGEIKKQRKNSAKHRTSELL